MSIERGGNFAIVGIVLQFSNVAFVDESSPLVHCINDLPAFRFFVIGWAALGWGNVAIIFSHI